MPTPSRSRLCTPFGLAAVALVSLVVAGAGLGCATSPNAGAADAAKPQNASQSPADRPAAAARAEDARPLKAGTRAPTAALRRPDGTPVDLAAVYAAKPTVLVFYRGGWCPYCNAHLGQVAKVEPELVKLGYQVLAVSPDAPEAVRASADKGGYQYQLLSDSDVELARAFGLAFRVDDPTVQKYRGFGIDLEKASGRSHHVLPVPAVYIVDTRGVIRFAHADADYKQRLSGDDLLRAARAAATPGYK